MQEIRYFKKALTCVMVPWREVSSAGMGRAQASSMLGNFFCLEIRKKNTDIDSI